MPDRLDLAALTDAELAALLGEDSMQALLPEITRARLEQRPVAGPIWPDCGWTELASGQPGDWGSSPAQTRTLNAIDRLLIARGAETIEGTLNMTSGGATSFGRGYELNSDTAICVHWSESLSDREPNPFLESLSWLKDDASGVVGVMTTNRVIPAAPYLTDALAVKHLPGAETTNVLDAHVQHLARHGRAVKLVGAEGWRSAWDRFHQLNLESWTRRGLIIRD